MATHKLLKQSKIATSVQVGGALAELPPHGMGSPDRPAGPFFDLHDAVRRQSWAWLGAIVRRLNLTIEVVDGRGSLCPPIVTTSSTTALRRTLAAAAPESLSLMANVASTNQRRRASIDGIDILAVPIAAPRGTMGVLVIARDLHPHAAPGEARSDAEVDAAGSWLARAIEAQLDVPTPDDEGDAFDRVSSLHRLLHEAVDRGVERDVLVAFAEALIAWDDIELRAYVEDVHGRFVLAVATPGTDRTEAAAIAVNAIDPVQPGLTRVPFQEAVRVGFRRDKDVFVARIGGGLFQPWLLIFSGVIGARDESRLALYVDLLREAVLRVATIAETRTSWAILQQLLGASGAFEQAGEAALAEVTRAVDALGSALVVTAANGMNVLSLGDGATFTSSRGSQQFEELAATLQVLDVHTLVLAVRRARGNTFTRRDQQLLNRAAETFAAWLPSVIAGRPQAQERRTESRGFDQLVERAAIQSVGDGLDVVLLLIVVPGAMSRPGLLHRWVTEMRGQLRASDLAGALSDREIGVLLTGTTRNDLNVVRERILRRVTLLEAGNSMPTVTIGVASWQAGSSTEGSLVQIARHDAARRARGSGEWQ